MNDKRTELDPADIFSSSLETLYSYQPITLASAGNVYTYLSNAGNSTGNFTDPLKIELVIPDTLPTNWFLHASDIWASSRHLADYIDQLHLDTFLAEKANGEMVNVLELGSGAGLPGILIAKAYTNVSVTVSDYPDELLIGTLSHNVRLNNVSNSCQVVPYAWGSDVTHLLMNCVGFDVVVAADTLWNPSLHTTFINTLQMTSKRAPSARIHLVAGLHTGRFTIQSFLNAVQEAGFEVGSVLEREVNGSQVRAWNVLENENEGEKRRWVVWIVLKWQATRLASSG